MKLCPQCDFIYEDDQSVCDMDGKELVYEPTLSAFPGKPALEQRVRLTQLRTRRFAVTAMAGLVLAATLLLFYNVFTPGVAPPTINSSSAPAPLAPTAASISTSNPIHPIPEENASPSDSVTPVASRSTPLAGEPGSADSQFATAGSTANAEQQPHQLSPANLSAHLSPMPGTNPRATDKRAAVGKTSPSLAVSSLPRVKALPRLKPLPRLEEENNAKKTGRAALSQRPVSVNQKKDSRVGSFFKKTARILTKPFKR